MFHVSQIMEAPLFRLSQSIKDHKYSLRKTSSLYLTALILLPILFFSCDANKDFDRLIVNPISLDTAQDIYGLVVINDSTIVAVGGTIWNEGFTAISSDAGVHWKKNILSTKALLSVDFKGEVIVASGIEGNHFFYKDQSWTERPTGNYGHVKDLILLNDSTSLSLGGGSYQNGFIDKVFQYAPVDDLFRYEAELRSLAQLNDSTFLAAGFGVLLKSSNYGGEWIIQDLNGDYFQDLCFIDDKTGFLLGYDGSLFKTVDGALSWEKLRNDNLLSADGLRAMHAENDQELWIVGNNGLVMYSMDGGLNWFESKLEAAGDLHDIDGHNKMIVAVGSQGSVFKLGFK